MYSEMREISEVISGYTFRGSIKNDPNGAIFVVQAKNIASDSDLDSISDLVPISEGGLRSPNFLMQGDVLLTSRGTGSFRSCVFTSDNPKVMPSSSVFFIRIKDPTVIPKYLSIYLNSEQGQKELMQVSTGSGSYIQTILLKNLLELKIPIPPIHIQKSIIALHENVLEQQRIIARKQQIQKNIINSVFTNLTFK
jgi:restriction endonuclease S subunit